MLNIKIGQHVIPFWYIVILLISGIGSGVLTYYAWPRKTIPSDVVMPGFLLWNRSEEIVQPPPASSWRFPSLNFPFRYFNYSGDKLWNYPAGISSYSAPSQTDIAFGVTVVNLAPSKESLVLEQYSRIWIYFPMCYEICLLMLVNAEPDGTITTPYTPISLAYGEPEMLVFASSVPGDFAKFSFGSDVENLPCAVNLLLYGKLGPRDYIHSIPLVALYIYNPYT